MKEAAGFVLAGGKSSRMGRDKAFVEFEGQTLLERALATVAAVVEDVAIVGPRARFAAFAPAVEDVYADRGPLGGIHAALQSSDAKWNVVLAVDMPLVPPELLSFLLMDGRRAEAMVTAYRDEQGWQPLCGVYRKEFGGLAQRALEAGHNKVDALFGETQVRAVSETELMQVGFARDMFRNLNTPAEFEAVSRGRLEQQGKG